MTRKTTPPDLKVMKAFARLLIDQPRKVSVAAAEWMWRVANDPKTVTKDELDKDAAGQQTGEERG